MAGINKVNISKACLKRLFENIRHYPDLYDTSRETYKDQGLKDNIWRNIAKEMGVDGMSGKYVGI